MFVLAVMGKVKAEGFDHLYPVLRVCCQGKR